MGIPEILFCLALAVASVVVPLAVWLWQEKQCIRNAKRLATEKGNER